MLRGEGVGEVDLVAAAEVHRRVLVDDALGERGESNRELDRGAGFGTGPQRELLVHHREHAAVLGVDGECGAVHVAERLDKGGADERVFAGGDVAEGDIVDVLREGGCGEVLDVAHLPQDDSSVAATKHGDYVA